MFFFLLLIPLNDSLLRLVSVVRLNKYLTLALRYNIQYYTSLQTTRQTTHAAVSMTMRVSDVIDDDVTVQRFTTD